MMEEDHYDTPWEFLARPNSVRLSAIDAALFAKGPAASSDSPQDLEKNRKGNSNFPQILKEMDRVRVRLG
ncbi:hypothetical protein NECAME_14999 [Necator americanus]|uniref:Uncharacterized protein n=1 Tax=Necator americanus TaxID=51031 RepID=W2SM38_NECAM|nr:hypothetical protein NECAME_14999 [Necator americanus]ETN69931.1 hypothetical protein NECAME_14999 [Necator americanus]